jgi:hypothetical protein
VFAIQEVRWAGHVTHAGETICAGFVVGEREVNASEEDVVARVMVFL